MAVTWPFFVALLLIGEPLLRVFGEGYTAGADTLAVLCGAMLLATLCGDVDVLLIMSGRTLWSMANMCVSLAVNVGLDLILIPEYGILGAAIGWATAIVLKNVLALIQIALLFRLSPAGREAAIVAGAVLGGIGVPLGLARLVGGEPWAVLAGLIAAVLLYGAVMWRLRYDLGLNFLLRRVSPRSASSL